MHVEEIHISSVPSDFVEEDLPETRISTAALRQSDRIRLRSIAFELFNRRLLSIKRKGAARSGREYELDIAILDPRPERSLRISRFYLSAFVIAATTAGLAGYTDLIPHSALLPTLLGAGGGSLSALIVAAYRSHDRLVFRSRHGRVPLVILLNRNPARKTFRKFTDELVRYIEDTEDSLASRSDRLSRELKELRRLMETGAISAKRYESVKRHLLGLHN